MGLFRRKRPAPTHLNEPAATPVIMEAPEITDVPENIDLVSPAEEAAQFVIKKTVIRTHYVGGVAIPVNVPKMGPPTDLPPTVQ